MPADACPLYSLQGATCDPGLIAHFTMPKRADADLKWLIVYVLLSRVRSLSNLRSVGLDTKIRTSIKGGPPTMIADNYENIFRKKIIATHAAAATAMSTTLVHYLSPSVAYAKFKATHAYSLIVTR